MDSLLTHRNQIRGPTIHHNTQANINSSNISKLKIDILSKPIPNFNLNLIHKQVVLPNLISIQTVAIILILILTIAIAIVVLRKMDHRTIIIGQDFRIPILRLSIILHQIFSQNLSSQMPIRRGRRIRMYRACRQRQTTVIRDAVVHRDQPQVHKLLVNQVLYRNVLPQTHRRLKVECSKYHWSTLSFVDTVIA